MKEMIWICSGSRVARLAPMFPDETTPAQTR
jgi:hypothetical protein